MKKLSALMVGAVLVCALQAKADLITLEDPFVGQGNPSEEAGLIKDKLNLSYTPTFLAKYEDGKAPEAGAVSVDRFIVPITGTTADSSWNLTGAGYELVYALVKAGQYYQIYGVVPGSNQEIIGDWVIQSPVVSGPNGPRQQNISHISFFGKPSNGVPDGGLTAMLLGFGLAGLGVGRRLIRK